MTGRRVTGTALDRESRGLLAPSTDRMDQWLIYAILGAIVLILGLAVWAVIAGLGRPLAPRTAAEREVYSTEAAVKAAPKDAQAWADYAAALVRAGRLGDALDAISKGEAAVGKVPRLLLAHARVLRAQGDAQGALREADDSIKASLLARKKKIDEAAAKGAFVKPTAVYAEEIIAAQVFRAEVLVDESRIDDAIAAYTNALEQSTQMSDVLSARADLFMRVKRYDDARKDYQQALKYIPDYQPALKGLANLNEVSK